MMVGPVPGDRGGGDTLGLFCGDVQLGPWIP